MIFVDTSALFALYKHDDPHHEKAVKTTRFIDQQSLQKVSSNLIISELLTLISMRVGKMKAIEAGKTLRTSGLVVYFIDTQLQEKAWNIFLKIKDKDVSFTDCSSFAVMESLGIRKAFSFDEDFIKYGFTLMQ